ncbi:MAG: trypsin-like peptidase domain-containing protein [Pseudonocardiaceae bacterium]
MSDGSAPTHRGVVSGQVAEIIVSLEGETWRRGSGYRVGPSAVLTAAHVVDGAASVRVRFDADLPDEWVTEVLSYWTDPRSDFAVLTIAPREGEPPLASALFGRISARAVVLAAQAVGFPLWKLRTDDGDRSVYRDSHQANGSVAVLSNRREGTLEITVPPPERDPDPGESPWEGLSGAAVWVGDRIVGVIAKHHRSDGLGRLAAARLDLAIDGLDSGRCAELRVLLNLPAVLIDVVPPLTSERVTTAYQAQVREVLALDNLLDREEELDELVEFCAGNQQYAWWQAGPWAGKSALTAWFVLHPPTGVDVVSFFVTARMVGQSDSDACIDALIEQLAALLGESPIGLLTVGARRGTMLRLLDNAASRSRETGRRLLLVIDGLDETVAPPPAVPASRLCCPADPRPRCASWWPADPTHRSPTTSREITRSGRSTPGNSTCQGTPETSSTAPNTNSPNS